MSLALPDHWPHERYKSWWSFLKIYWPSVPFWSTAAIHRRWKDKCSRGRKLEARFSTLCSLSKIFMLSFPFYRDRFIACTTCLFMNSGKKGLGRNIGKALCMFPDSFHCIEDFSGVFLYKIYHYWGYFDIVVMWTSGRVPMQEKHSNYIQPRKGNNEGRKERRQEGEEKGKDSYDWRRKGGRKG